MTNGRFSIVVVRTVEVDADLRVRSASNAPYLRGPEKRYATLAPMARPTAYVTPADNAASATCRAAPRAIGSEVRCATIPPLKASAIAVTRQLSQSVVAPSRYGNNGMNAPIPNDMKDSPAAS